MTITEWLEQHPGRPVTVDDGSSVDQVIMLMLEQTGVRDVYVVEKDTVLGHISHRRLAHIALAEHRREHTRRQIMERVFAGSARDLMDPHFASARPEEELDDVVGHMLEHDVEDLPVLDHRGRLVGAINLTDVLRVMTAEEKV